MLRYNVKNTVCLVAKFHILLPHIYAFEIHCYECFINSNLPQILFVHQLEIVLQVNATVRAQTQ